MILILVKILKPYIRLNSRKANSLMISCWFNFFIVISGQTFFFVIEGGIQDSKLLILLFALYTMPNLTCGFFSFLYISNGLNHVQE